MAMYDTADLVQRFRDASGLPAVDNSTPVAKIYRLLTSAQEHWTEQIAAQVPRAMYTAPALLTSSDDGLTYDLGVEPLALRVKESASGELLLPGPDWDDSTGYVLEGSIIRFPNNVARTFADGPYAQWIAPAGVIDASNEPTLLPARARPLIVWRALINWCVPYRDPSQYQTAESDLWIGDADNAADNGLLGALKQQYDSGFAVNAGHSQWWNRPDLGR